MSRLESLPAARPDPYRVLDVPPDADAATISRAYWKLAKQFHPDRNGSALGRRLMLVVNEAYETLKNPERRAAWDRTRQAAAGRGLAAESRPPTGPSRTTATPTPHAPAPPIVPPPGPILRRMAQQAGADQGADGRSRPSTLEFGRYAGRTIPEVATLDPDYLQWFIRTPLGRSYAAEVAATR